MEEEIPSSEDSSPQRNVRRRRGPVIYIDVHQLASAVKNRCDNCLILDSRSFLEYNTCHVLQSVSICCSKIVKRRLQQDQVSVKDLLKHSCHHDILDNMTEVIVYDQGSDHLDDISEDTFLSVLMEKLAKSFVCLKFVVGGFLEFQSKYPNLCDDMTLKTGYGSMTALSQPCLPTAGTEGPTRILPFLFLGSQSDSLSQDCLNDHNITYELNVSNSCPKSEYVQESHFMRIPVDDNYTDKLLPYFNRAFQFLEKVRIESSGCAIVHCVAGVSRSATVVIAYLMRYSLMTSDEAYRYVKSKRPSISPNFNFLGQLLEYEKQLIKEKILFLRPTLTRVKRSTDSSDSAIGTSLLEGNFGFESGLNANVPHPLSLCSSLVVRRTGSSVSGSGSLGSAGSIQSMSSSTPGSSGSGSIPSPSLRLNLCRSSSSSCASTSPS